VDTACTAVSSLAGVMSSNGSIASIGSIGSLDVDAPRSVRRVVMLVFRVWTTKKNLPKIDFCKKFVLRGMHLFFKTGHHFLPLNATYCPLNYCFTYHFCNDCTNFSLAFLITL
jgi:hypothetical protein